MGLRKPSGWQTFTAQAYAGAGQQQKAREEMKEPGKTKQALGGMGSAGTSMVAATTGAQQQATKQMQETTAQASKDLKVDPSKIGTATADAITSTSGTATAPASVNVAAKYTQADLDTANAELENLRKRKFNSMIGSRSMRRLDNEISKQKQKINEMNAYLGANGGVMGLAETGDVAAIEKVGESLNKSIDEVNKQIDGLDEQLKTANAQDAQKIQAEKDRLNELLEVYNKKLSEENLGKIADQSTFETEMEKRERVLAEKGDNVGKLATLFGRRSVGDKALASQIYGKDLENIQKAAAQGLISKEQAEQAAAEAETQYSEQIDASKEGFEKEFETEDRKLELLKMSPEELKGVTQEEVEKLFGKEMADRLFDYKDGYVSDSQSSMTKRTLEDRLTKLKEESGKIEQAKTKAKDITVKNLKNTYFPVDEYGAAKPSIIEQELTKLTTIPDKVSKTSYYGPFGMFSKTVSKDSGNVRQQLIDKYSDQIAAIENNLRNAVNAGDAAEAKRLAQKMGWLRLEIDQGILKYKQSLQEQGYK